MKAIKTAFLLLFFCFGHAYGGLKSPDKFSADAIAGLGPECVAFLNSKLDKKKDTEGRFVFFGYMHGLSRDEVNCRSTASFGGVLLVDRLTGRIFVSPDLDNTANPVISDFGVITELDQSGPNCGGNRPTFSTPAAIKLLGGTLPGTAVCVILGGGTDPFPQFGPITAAATVNPPPAKPAPTPVSATPPASTVTPSSPQNLSSTDRDLLLDGKVFDADFYAALYSGDIARSGLSPSEHWLTFGAREGRTGSPELSVQFYLSSYPDLQKAYGLDWIALIKHYLTFGKAEGRIGFDFFNPAVFDATIYAALNPDLSGLSVTQRQLHWMFSGIYEGRRANLHFDVNQYLQRYPDLAAAFAGNPRGALNHFVLDGAPQGRQGTLFLDPAVFVAEDYLDLNPDVRQASLDNNPFSSQEDYAAVHFLIFGINEGRRSSKVFSVRDYLDLNPDVAAAFNNNFAAAFIHYVMNGRFENRQTLKR